MADGNAAGSAGLPEPAALPAQPSAGVIDEDDLLAGVVSFDLPDAGPGFLAGAAGLVVVGSEFDVAGAGVADEDPGDLADHAGDRDDGFLLAALAGDPPVHRAEPGAGPGRRHHGLAERAAQVRVAFAGAAVPGPVAGLHGAGGQPGPGGGVPGGGERGGV